jgi:hypothetical protein
MAKKFAHMELFAVMRSVIACLASRGFPKMCFYFFFAQTLLMAAITVTQMVSGKKQFRPKLLVIFYDLKIIIMFPYIFITAYFKTKPYSKYVKLFKNW